MARCAHTVPPTRGSGMTAVCVVLLALVVTLLSPSSLFTALSPCSLFTPLSPPSVSAADARVPGGPVLAAGTASADTPVRHGGPYAGDADPDGSTAAVRSHRNATGERHAPPVAAPGASSGEVAAGSLRAAHATAWAARHAASEPPTHRHGVRAPPSLSGI